MNPPSAPRHWLRTVTRVIAPVRTAMLCLSCHQRRALDRAQPALRGERPRFRSDYRLTVDLLELTDCRADHVLRRLPLAGFREHVDDDILRQALRGLPVGGSRPARQVRVFNRVLVWEIARLFLP